MGRTYEAIDSRLADWMTSQPVFFISTAPLDPQGLINCSPKGNRQEFAVLGDRTVAYLDQTGSGVETIAHLQENGRIVVMFCALVGPPRIVRLHGAGRAIPKDAGEFAQYAKNFPGYDGIGVRSIIVIDVDRVSDSCGYGVPLMSFVRHRTTMDEWAARKGPDGIWSYWLEKNTSSIDDLPGLPITAEPFGGPS